MTDDLEKQVEEYAKEHGMPLDAAREIVYIMEGKLTGNVIYEDESQRPPRVTIIDVAPQYFPELKNKKNNR